MDMASAKSRVLVVDSHQRVAQRLIEVLLEDNDVEVLGPVHCAEEAAADCRRYRPDAVVVDADTLGGSGLAWAKSVRDDAPGLVIIVLCLDGQPSVHEAYRAAGVDHVLRKHNEFERVPALIRERSSPSPSSR